VTAGTTTSQSLGHRFVSVAPRRARQARERIVAHLSQVSLRALSSTIGPWVHSTSLLSGLSGTLRGLEEEAVLTCFAIATAGEVHCAAIEPLMPFSLTCVSGLMSVMPELAERDDPTRWSRLLTGIAMHHANSHEICVALRRLSESAKGSKNIKRAVADIAVRIFTPRAANGFASPHSTQAEEIVRTAGDVFRLFAAKWLQKAKYHTFALPLAGALLCAGGRELFSEWLMPVLRQALQLLVDEKRVRSRTLRVVCHVAGFYCTVIQRKSRALGPPTPMDADEETAAQASQPHLEAFDLITESILLFKKVPLTHHGFSTVAALADVMLQLCRARPKEGIEAVLSHLPADPHSILYEGSAAAIYCLHCLTTLTDPDLDWEACKSIPLKWWNLGPPPGSGDFGLDDVAPKVYSPFSSFRHASLARALVPAVDADVIFDVARYVRGDGSLVQQLREELEDARVPLTERLWTLLLTFERECCTAAFQRSIGRSGANASVQERDRLQQHLMVLALDIAAMWITDEFSLDRVLKLSVLPKAILHLNSQLADVASTKWLPVLLFGPLGASFVASLMDYAMGGSLFDDADVVFTLLTALFRVLSCMPHGTPSPTTEGQSPSYGEVVEACALMALGHVHPAVREVGLALLLVARSVDDATQRVRRTPVAATVLGAGRWIAEESAAVVNRLSELGVNWADESRSLRRVGTCFAKTSKGSLLQFESMAEAAYWEKFGVKGARSESPAAMVRRLRPTEPQLDAFASQLQQTNHAWVLLGCVVRRQVIIGQRLSTFLAAVCGRTALSGPTARTPEQDERVVWDQWKALFVVWIFSCTIQSRRHASDRGEWLEQLRTFLTTTSAKLLPYQDLHDVMLYALVTLDHAARTSAGIAFPAALIVKGVEVVRFWIDETLRTALAKRDRRRVLIVGNLAFHMLAALISCARHVGVAGQSARSRVGADGPQVAMWEARLLELFDALFGTFVGTNLAEISKAGNLCAFIPALPAVVTGEDPEKPLSWGPPANYFEFSFGVQHRFAVVAIIHRLAGQKAILSDRLDQWGNFLVGQVALLAPGLTVVEAPVSNRSPEALLDVCLEALSGVIEARLGLRGSSPAWLEAVMVQFDVFTNSLSSETVWGATALPRSRWRSVLLALSRAPECLRRFTDVVEQPKRRSSLGTVAGRANMEVLLECGIAALQRQAAAQTPDSSRLNAAMPTRKRPSTIEQRSDPSVVWPPWAPGLIALALAHIARGSRMTPLCRHFFSLMLKTPPPGTPPPSGSLGESRGWAAVFLGQAQFTDADFPSAVLRVALRHVACSKDVAIQSLLADAVGVMASHAKLSADEWAAVCEWGSALSVAHPAAAEVIWASLSDSVHPALHELFEALLVVSPRLVRYAAQQLGRQARPVAAAALFEMACDALRAFRSLADAAGTGLEQVVRLWRVYALAASLLRYSSIHRLFDSMPGALSVTSTAEELNISAGYDIPSPQYALQSPAPDRRQRTPSARPETPRSPVRFLASASPANSNSDASERFRQEVARLMSNAVAVLLCCRAGVSEFADWGDDESALLAIGFAEVARSVGGDTQPGKLLHHLLARRDDVALADVASCLRPTTVLRWIRDLVATAKAPNLVGRGTRRAMRVLLAALSDTVLGSTDASSSASQAHLFALQTVLEELTKGLTASLGDTDTSCTMDVAKTIADVVAMEAVSRVFRQSENTNGPRSIFSLHALYSTMWFSICLMVNYDTSSAGAAILDGLYRGGAVQMLAADAHRYAPHALPFAEDEWAVLEVGGIETAPIVFAVVHAAASREMDAVRRLLNTFAEARPKAAVAVRVLLAIMAGKSDDATEQFTMLLQEPERSVPPGAYCMAPLPLVVLTVEVLLAVEGTSAPCVSAALAVAITAAAGDLGAVLPDGFVLGRLKEAMNARLRAATVPPCVAMGTVRRALINLEAVAKALPVDVDLYYRSWCVFAELPKQALRNVAESVTMPQAFGDAGALAPRQKPIGSAGRSPAVRGRHTRNRRSRLSMDSTAYDAEQQLFTAAPPPLRRDLFTYCVIELDDGGLLVADARTIGGVQGSDEDEGSSLQIDHGYGGGGGIVFGDTSTVVTSEGDSDTESAEGE
jgi:hypothetical protein